MGRYLSAYDIEAEIVPPSRYTIDFSHSVNKTVQSGKDDSDINVIVRRFKLSGQLPPVKAEPFYGDFSEVEDYHSAMNKILEARSAFMELPAETRKRFSNDPQELIDYLNNPELDREEARKLGLLLPEVAAPEPQKVVVENWPAPSEGPA